MWGEITGQILWCIYRCGEQLSVNTEDKHLTLTKQTMKFSTKPPRWTADRYGHEFTIRMHIFDTWRRVCRSFGYEEYLCPLVEKTDLYRAKSWEDVGGSELTQLTDREGNISELSLRPEMTPSVTRMVSGMYPQMNKPVRLFSIANFYRNERPQRGRNREFRQLNVDMFGTDSDRADIEMMQLAIEIMSAFNSPEQSYCMHINHRSIIDDFLSHIEVEEGLKKWTVAIMDSCTKLPTIGHFKKALLDSWLDNFQVERIIQFTSTRDIEDIVHMFPSLEDSEGVRQIRSVMDVMDEMWYADVVMFNPFVVRWLDYYDWLVFEVVDMHKDNNRAMFGWWRYNWLSHLFWKDIPAIWMGMGDETMKLFLESWWMTEDILSSKWDTKVFMPILSDDDYGSYALAANRLRKILWCTVELDVKIRSVSSATKYAKKKWYERIAVLWGDRTITVRSLYNWSEEKYRF